MHRIVSIFFLFLLVTGVTGCSQTPEDVHLANQKEITQYVNLEYGPADFLYSTELENEIQYTFKDNEYEFCYTVSSKASAFAMDGSVFGYYEKKESDFKEIYSDYLFHQIRLKLELEQDERFRSITMKNLFTIYVDNENYAEFIAQEYGHLFEQMDNRRFFSNEKIYIKENEDTMIGAYDLQTKRYKTEEELDAEFFMDAIQKKLREHNDYSVVTYLYREEVLVSSIPELAGRSDARLSHASLQSTDRIMKYYFLYKGKKYFVVDFYLGEEEGFFTNLILESSENP